MIIIASLKDIICTGVIRCLNKVYASEFIGKLTGNADTATKATQDESGNNIKSSYASSISISDHTITLKNKNGVSLGTVTVPDNNTTYSTATTSANGLMSASDKSKLDGITASADAVSFARSLTSGTKIGTITINGTGTDLYCQTNTDTHYTSHLYVGTSGGNANATSATSNPYLLCVDNTTNRNSIQLKAGSNMSISAVNGVITFSSTDTNTTYSAGTGISLSGTTFSNAGVRSIATGGTNGTISVNTNGTSANVAVKGLGSAAYTNSSAYAASSGSNNYVRVWNSSSVGSVDNLSINDLAKQHFSMAMVNNATDNPQGGKYWNHVINMSWNNGVNTSWCSQIALGVDSSDGMWYRTTEGTIVGAAWKRVLDSNNYKTYCTPANIGAAASFHTHNYAGSSSAGGSATSAVKLDSSAGSATQPVYFSSGKPVACTYTLGKSVPSNAVFTDTNTWRPVTDNLTSTSTSNCLSANQGRVLKGLIDGKSDSGHTHSNYLENTGGYISCGGNGVSIDGDLDVAGVVNIGDCAIVRDDSYISCVKRITSGSKVVITIPRANHSQTAALLDDLNIAQWSEGYGKNVLNIYKSPTSWSVSWSANYSSNSSVSFTPSSNSITITLLYSSGFSKSSTFLVIRYCPGLTTITVS